MNEPHVHMLSAMTRLTDEQLSKIMEVLDCEKVVCDQERKLYYFINKTCLQ